MSIKDNLAPLWGYKIRGLSKATQEANNAYLEALQSEITRSQKAMYQAKLESFLDTANNLWLDYWGSWLGLRRYSGESDNAYRKRLKSHVLHQRNTINAIRKAVANFLKVNMDRIYIYEPYRDMMIYNSSKWNTYKFYPSTYYRYAVIDVQIDAPINQMVSQVINLFRPAGVYWVITSLINVLNPKAPIIDFSGDTSGIIETDEINYAGFMLRDYEHLTPNFARNIDIKDPFIYNDSLLNGGKVYYALGRDISSVAWLGKAQDMIQPKKTDTYMDAFHDVTHLGVQDEGKLSDMDGQAVEFNIGRPQNSVINLFTQAERPDQGLSTNSDPTVTSSINANNEMVVHMVMPDAHLSYSNVGTYYFENTMKANQYYILSVDVRGNNAKADSFGIHENVNVTPLSDSDSIHTKIGSDWKRVAFVLKSMTDNPSGAFTFYFEAIDKTKSAWVDYKSICLQQVSDPKPYIQNGIIPMYVDLPEEQGRTTLLGAFDLYDYFQDGNQISNSKVELVKKGLAGSNYLSIVMMIKKANLIGSQKLTLYMFDFSVNMWVKFTTYDLSSGQYQLIKINLNQLDTYLNDNGLVFIKLVPEVKQGSLDIDYFGFNYGKTLTRVTSFTPSQTGLGADLQ